MQTPSPLGAMDLIEAVLLEAATRLAPGQPARASAQVLEEQVQAFLRVRLGVSGWFGHRVITAPMMIPNGGRNTTARLPPL